MGMCADGDRQFGGWGGCWRLLVACSVGASSLGEGLFVELGGGGRIGRGLADLILAIRRAIIRLGGRIGG